MQARDFRDWTLGFGLLLAIAGLIFINIWLLISDKKTTQTFSNEPYLSAYCDPLKEGYMITISIDNYYGKKIMKDVKCEIISKGTFTVIDSEEQLLGDVEKGNKNNCYFVLKGDYEGPVVTSVKYSGKSINANSFCRSYDYYYKETPSGE